MFCPNCGTKNEDEALFCGNCGTRLVIDVPQEQEVASAPVQEQEVVSAPVQESEEAPAPVQAEAVPEAPAQENVETVQPEPVMQQGVPAQPQQQAFGQQTYQFNNQPQQASMPKQKKSYKIDKKIIVSMAAAVVVLTALIVFSSIGRDLTDYQKTAKRYVKAVAECEWDDAYALLNVPDGEFLTKEAFVNAHADATGEKVEKIAADDTITTFGKMPGNKSVNVAYKTASGVQTQNVYLTVSNKHFMLFFKKYKVSSENVVVKDCTIRVPKGLTLYINDKIVGDAYKTSKSNGSSSDEYLIPYLFYGNNDIKVTGDFIEDYTTQLYAAYEGDTVTIGSYNVKYSDDKLEELKTQAKTDVDAIMSSVQAKKDFSSVSDKVANDDKKNVESTYKNIFDSYNDKYKKISDFKLTKFTASIADTSFRVDSEDGCPSIKVGIKLGYSYKIQYSSSDKASDKNNTNNSAYIYYKYEDGKWKITSMYLGLGFY